MKCPVCNKELEKVNVRCDHLLLTKNSSDGHIHVHGDIDKKDFMCEMIETAIKETNVNTHKQKLEKKELVFHNRQRIGDILMFTAGVRDFKKEFPDVRVNVISTAEHIWDYNPNIDRSLPVTSENMVKIGPGKLTNASNRLDWHFANAFRMSIEDALNVHISQGESRPDIWFTEEEYNASRLFKEPYWVICIGGEKSWGCKMYPFDKWQKFINQNQDVLFIQIGAREDKQPKLQGNNVIDHVGKTQDHNTGIRDLFKLFLNAEGSIGLVSFHMHLSGALYKPCIVVAGAREPVSFTRYQGHQYLTTEGCLPCSETTACWHCNIDNCSNLVINKEKIPKCVDMIEPKELTRALNSYYIGGRLKKGVISAKPKLKNIVKTPIEPRVPIFILPDVSKYNMTWGGDCITDKDWEFILNTIKKHSVKTVLEFGASLSTLLLHEEKLDVVTYENDQNTINKLKKINSKLDIRIWNGKTLDLSDRFDFAFVDAPRGGINREISTKLASEHSDIVIIHDANREFEKKWQDKYIKDKFDGPIKGGHRCSLWIKKAEDIKQTQEIIPQTPTIAAVSEKINGKYIKFVFNGRGDGGAERSVVWMMNKLIELGHRVTYHTPNEQPCGTFRSYGNNNITVDDCNTLNEACDILVLYCNDWVWSFSKNEICDIFSNINAQKKILCVNYRMDKIGLISWTKNWDRYLFLNSSFEKTLLERCPEAKTDVFAPPTDLTKFFTIKQDYSNGLRLIRHSSQGDVKYPKNFNEIVKKILEKREDISIRLMPAPSFLSNFNGKVIVHQKNNPSVDEFLKFGNCFWYKLPDDGYLEGGPKVVMEAQASGLAVIADNHSGMRDRVVNNTGWLCDSIEDHLNIVKSITSKELKEFGENAREHARKSYDPMNWISAILE